MEYREATKKFVILWLFMLCIIHLSDAQTIEGSFVNKFKRYQKDEQFAGTNTFLWSDTVWKGDRIHKQILLWSSSNISNITYQISDLVGNIQTIPFSNINLRFGKYIKGDPLPKVCSSYPSHPSYVEIADALSPTQINSITSSDPIKLWVTIDIPPKTSEGIYDGTITINGAVNPVVFDIKLLVINFTLPPVSDWNFHLDLWQFPVKVLDFYNATHPSTPIAIWSDAHFQLFSKGYKILADMGQKSITAHIKKGALGAASMIKWTKKSNGLWEYDFSVFDKFVDSMMNWGITKQINCFSPVGWNKTVIPYWDEASGINKELDAPIGSAAYIETWNDFLNQFRNHLNLKGWFEKVVLFMDEVPENEMTEVVDMIKNNYKDWKIGLAYGHNISSTLMNSLYDASGILGTTYNAGREGYVTTYYTSCSQTTPNNYITPTTSPAEMTWMPWYALNQNYNGYLRWAYDYWQMSDAYDARDGGNTAGDFSMIYRGSNSDIGDYISGIRTEMLREGIQDFEKVNFLKSYFTGTGNSYALDKLNEAINRFNSSSGSIAQSIVFQGQSLLKGIVFSTNGIDNYEEGKEIKCFPNPTKTELFFRPPANESISTITIYNSLGRLMEKCNYPKGQQSDKRVSTSDLKAGIYYVIVKWTKGVKIEKIVKI